jgi:hypothetical protein
MAGVAFTARRGCRAVAARVASRGSGAASCCVAGWQGRRRSPGSRAAAGGRGAAAYVDLARYDEREIQRHVR